MSSSRAKKRNGDGADILRTGGTGDTHAVPPSDTAKSTRRGATVPILGRRLVNFGKSDDQNTTKNRSGLRISSPFGFHKMRDDQLVSPLIRKVGPPSPDKHRLSACSTPTEKPLPSLPAADDSTLPTRHGLLLDATEGLSRRGESSPESEIWPVTSIEAPEKSGISDRQHRSLRPSLGESIIERVRKLNLNDDGLVSQQISILEHDDVPAINTIAPPHTVTCSSIMQNNDAATVSTMTAETPGSFFDISNSPPEVDSHLAAHSLPVKSKAPSVLESQVFNSRRGALDELKKRTSSNQLTSDDQKRSKTMPVELEGTSSLQSCLDGSGDEDKQLLLGGTTPRSRSRHRVTEEGSPYHVPRQAQQIRVNKISARNDDSNSSLRLRAPISASTRCLGEDIGFGSQDESMLSPQLVAVRERRVQPRDAGRSSIPLPSRLVRRQSCPMDETTDTYYSFFDSNRKVTQHKRDEVSALDVESKCGAVSAEVIRSASPFQQSRTYGPGISTGATMSDDENSELKDAQTTNHPDLHVDNLVGKEQYDTYRIKPVANNARGYGPCLRISESANQLLLGSEGSHPDASTVMLSDSQSSPSNKTQKSLPKETYEELKMLGFGHETDALPRSPVCISTTRTTAVPVEAESDHPSTSTAPPVKPGIPQDISSKFSWPFRESVVAPFRNLDQAYKKGTHATMAPATSSNIGHDKEVILAQSTPTPDLLRESRLDLVEMLRERPGMAPSAGIDETLNVNQKNMEHTTEYPPRTSSRQANTRHVKFDGNKVAVFPSNSPPLNMRDYAIDGPPRDLTSKTKYMKSFSQSIRQTQPSPLEEADVISSPNPVPGTISAGKGVVHNIRSFFQKHNLPHSGVTGKLHESVRAVSGPVKDSKCEAPPRIPSSRIPRSPRVRNTTPTLYQRRRSRLEPKSFLRHRDVMTVISPTARESGRDSKAQNHHDDLTASSPITDESSVIHTNIDENAATDAIDDDPIYRHNSGRDAIEEGTSLVYNLLDQAKDEPRTNVKMRMIELSKILVQILQSARDAEKCKEEAIQSAARAEIECAKIKNDIGAVVRVVQKLQEKTNSYDFVRMESERLGLGLPKAVKIKRGR